jgi:transcription initiation factor TFIIH subunit 1
MVIILYFNNLKGNRGDEPTAKRRRIDAGKEVYCLSLLPEGLFIDAEQQDAYSQIDLDDLHDPEASAGIILEMQDRQRYFEGQMASAASADGAAGKVSLSVVNISSYILILRCDQSLDIRAILGETKVNLHDWETNLAQVRRIINYLRCT